MRKLSYYVAATLDGFIAAPDGSFGFFPPSQEMIEFIAAEFPETLPTHVRNQMGLDAANKRFDTVIMGRGTYQPALDVGITSPYAHLSQYVVSRSLVRSNDAAIELVGADPVSCVRRLKQDTGLDVWLAGGGRLAGALLPEIDELIIKRYPIVIGAGIPVISAEFHPLNLNVTAAHTFADGTTVTTYARTSDTPQPS